MRKLVAACAVLALSSGVSACGNDRPAVPDLTALGKPGKTLDFASADGSLRFRFPATWTVTRGEAPLVATLASGSALASIYAYPREDLGTDPASVRASLKRVLASLEERDPGFLVQSTRVTEVDGSPAVEIVGRGLVAGTVVRTRSVHVYKDETEWVVNAYAIPGSFDAADRIAFEPLLQSAELADRVGKGAGGGEG